MNNFSIRFAKLSDVDAIMNFIAQNWKKDHILSINKSFFLYEYAFNEQVNFAIAINQLNNEIVGICGFIKNSELLEGSNIWGSIWKVIKTDNPMLGINIIEFINKKSGCKTFSSCGIAKKTIPIYDYLRFKTGKLNHYYKLNNQIDFKIAIINKKSILNIEEISQFKIFLFTDFLELSKKFIRLESKNNSYDKDNWYIEKRYFNHPIYKYKIFGILNNEINSILVAREILINESKILRIIDFIGNLSDINHIGKAIENLIQKNNYEYVDFYCNGIDEKILFNAGFCINNINDTNIIPNYFEPFVQENIDIHFFTTCINDFIVFKGDGDQDRPSFI